MAQFFYLFVYTLSLSFILPLLFSSASLVNFAPFLILCFYRFSIVACLWWSFLCGFIVDLYAADSRLGTYAFNYCLATLCLYRYKFHFFEDRLSTLPTMSFNFSFLFTLTQITIFYLFKKNFTLSLDEIFYSSLIIPLQTTLYTLFTFTLPYLIISSIQKKYSRFRFKRRRQ